MSDTAVKLWLTFFTCCPFLFGIPILLFATRSWAVPDAVGEEQRG